MQFFQILLPCITVPCTPSEHTFTVELTVCIHHGRMELSSMPSIKIIFAAFMTMKQRVNTVFKIVMRITDNNN